MKRVYVVFALMILFVFHLSACGGMLYLAGEYLGSDSRPVEDMESGDDASAHQPAGAPETESVPAPTPLPPDYNEAAPPESTDDAPQTQAAPNFPEETPPPENGELQTEPPPGDAVQTLPSEDAVQTLPPDFPEDTTQPPPEPSAASNAFAFPFAFSGEDLYGNPVTEETLGQKELFVAYLWATW